MTRLNLTETCLLEVSGELGEKARLQLREHVATFPAAKLEYEVIKGQFEMLTSIPKPVLTDEQRRAIASGIKQGIHKKLRANERAEQARNRWKLVYKAMAGVSAIAACAVIAVTIYTVQQNMEDQRREMAIKQINDFGRVMQESENENAFGESIRNVAAGIDSLQKDSGSAVAGVQTQEMSNLLDALSNIPQDEEAPDVKPGAL